MGKKRIVAVDAWEEHWKIIFDRVKQMTPEEKRAFHKNIGPKLKTLTPREEQIMRIRFGLPTGGETIEETQKRFEITKARIRQIEMKALRKLRNPARGKL